MAIESNKVYRLFCKSAPRKNITVVNGGNVVGTKFNIQPYLSNSTWQYFTCSTFYDDPNDPRGVQFTFLNFQCNWNNEQVHGDLHPAITGVTTKVEGEQIKLNTSDQSGMKEYDRCAIKFVPANKKVNVNGYDYDGYYIEFCNKKVLDIKDSYLAVYDNTGADSQIFALVPDRAFNDSVTKTISLSGSTSCDINKTAKVNVSLNNGLQHCQARVRVATLAHNATSFTDYEDYISPSGSKVDDGFENGWGYNTGDNFDLTIEAANTTKAIDAKKYEITYRDVYDWDNHRYNKETIFTLISRQKISYEIEDALISADGLKITWTSNAYRNEGVTTVALSDVTSEGQLICKGRTQNFTSAVTGTFEIPYTELVKYPISGSTIRVKMKISLTSLYAVGEANLNKDVIVVAEGGDLHPWINVTTDNGYDLILSVTEKDSKSFNTCKCSMIYEHNGNVVVKELVKTGTNSFFAPARINHDTFFVANIEDTTQSPSKWGVCSYTYTYAERIPTTLVINSETLEYEFKYSKEQWPGDKNDSPSYQSLHKFGKRLPDVYYETNSDNKVSFSGLMIKTTDIGLLEQVLSKKYLAVRSSKGYYANCAFGGKQYTEYDKDTSLCTLEFMEVDRDVDVALPY